MEAGELDIFVKGVTEYFKQTLGAEPEIGIPYVENSGKNNLYDYTGIIGITGGHKGAVYMSCQREILEGLVKAFLGNNVTDENSVRDMAGEIANTIAGNVSKAFGNAFQITVPLIMTGSPDSLVLPIEIPAHVIPIKILGKNASLVVGIKANA